jgi:hypothetical protein
MTSSTQRLAAGVICSAVALTTGCRRDPDTAYARMLERAASWSAAIQFTNELARSGRVPHTYVHNVLSTAADGFASVRQQILEDDDIPQAERENAAAACERLASIVETAYRDKAMADDKELREVELRLRETATRVRSGAAALRQ